MKIEKSDLVAFAARERENFESALREFVEIPTVSADPAHAEDIRNCAELACDTIREFEDVMAAMGRAVSSS